MDQVHLTFKRTKFGKKKQEFQWIIRMAGIETIKT